MTDGPMIDIERIYATGSGERRPNGSVNLTHDWLVSAWPNAVEIVWKQMDSDTPGVRFDLTPDEAHELGTKLRLMARKARG